MPTRKPPPARGEADRLLADARGHAERLVSGARGQVAELTALAAQDREATSTAVTELCGLAEDDLTEISTLVKKRREEAGAILARRPRQHHPHCPGDDRADSFQGPQVGLETMSLGTLLQRSPDRLDLGVVQLGWASGGCPRLVP
ncbi:hypothetical protein OG520_39200 [Streptomyces sp. NBC_00984]|uniref:hypothetical protein n=1 Tax=Streptomyces sp. NBC_00984 TaxID=2903700 RepID=UPI00386C835A|nr:hypothetical protein OG520_39200 [Streptomyces sp. NBC_00984]